MSDEPCEFGCKFCGSDNLVKNGMTAGKQGYLCKDCGHKFAGNDSFIGTHKHIETIGQAVELFYRGIPTNTIDEQLLSLFQDKVNSSTIWRWVIKYSEMADQYLSNFPAKLSDTWLVDETQIKIMGRPAWYWDVIDEKTRFLVGTHLSRTRTVKDVVQLFQKCKARSKTKPKQIISDKMPAYKKGINKVFYSRYKEKRTEHVQMKGMSSDVNINIIERFHGTIKQRYRVLRGLRTDRTAQIILDGFVTHYNYFKPHITLKDKVPADVADVEWTYENWQALLQDVDMAKGKGELRENISRESLNHYA
jgi:transposase-like protein